MLKGWEELEAAREEFNQKKSEENAKIAATRVNLSEERRKKSLSNEPQRIAELERKVAFSLDSC